MDSSRLKQVVKATRGAGAAPRVVHPNGSAKENKKYNTAGRDGPQRAGEYIVSTAKHDEVTSEKKWGEIPFTSRRLTRWANKSRVAFSRFANFDESGATFSIGARGDEGEAKTKEKTSHDRERESDSKAGE
uniref:Uncharacterized protein n=1 Tax=Timema tahoe TaxID=61484 RepID=A0A7R9IAW4_9NEOP|nr:unnamed protein product [Timema tahoe]